MKTFLKFILNIFILISVFFSFSNVSKCDIDTTKNKEFILTFLPNYHNNWRSFEPRLQLGDSIYIFIYAEVPTKGTISYRDISNRIFLDSFYIPDPNVIYVFKKPAFNYALRGYNLSGTISNNNYTEKIVDLSFVVKADYPVQVYGHSQAKLTSESFNVLPIESLGKNYLVLAYNANVSNFYDAAQQTPSQFAIVATEDNTSVEIIPSVPTYYNGNKTQQITMNSGQVYMVQSLNEGDDPDLSRTSIKSDKPIAVFSGQQRTQVPYNVKGNNVSRDYIVEQMPPVESWSNEAIVVPFPTPSKMEASDRIYDKYRIIAAFDNTELYVDNILLANLNKGEIFEDDLRFPIHIKANSPIMAAAYKRSSGISISSPEYRGDPLLQIIPTPNQFGESYRFIAIQAYEYDEYSGLNPKYNKVYDEHFITVITEPENVSSLSLDGNPVNPLIFKPIEGSNYRYAHIKINEGTHQMSGNLAFGLFVCGYGNANSYGYFSGVVVKRDDYEPPTFQSSVDCFEANGIVNDEKIKSVSAPLNSLENVKVNIEKFNPYVKEVKFDAKLINKFADGFFKIIAADSVGQQSSKNIEIPGYTVTIESNLKNDEQTKVALLQDSLMPGTTKCYNYKIINYGKFEHSLDISKFLAKNPNITINTKDKFTIKPGENIDFQLCVFSNTIIEINDTLYFEDDCTKRNALAINILYSKDENAPQVSSFKDPCNQYIDLFITDSLKTDVGIDTIIVNQSNNLDYRIIKINNKSYKLNAKVIDYRNDSYIKITAQDLVGLETVFEHSLPGYTIDFSMIELNSDSTMVYDFGKKLIGVRYCDSIKLSNYGKYEIIFDNVKLSENIWFSAPPSQLPIILKPGDEIDMKICYWSNNLKKDLLTDTLNFNYNCIDKQVILLGQPDSIHFTNNSKCDIPLEFNVNEIRNVNFSTIAYPNPSNDIVNIIFKSGNTDLNDVNVSIFNQIGEEVKKLVFSNLPKANYQLAIDISHLENGYYIYIININNNIQNGTFIKLK